MAVHAAAGVLFSLALFLVVIPNVWHHKLAGAVAWTWFLVCAAMFAPGLSNFGDQWVRGGWIGWREQPADKSVFSLNGGGDDSLLKVLTWFTVFWVTFYAAGWVLSATVLVLARIIGLTV